MPEPIQMLERAVAILRVLAEDHRRRVTHGLNAPALRRLQSR
jgi:hypothetical protein